MSVDNLSTHVLDPARLAALRAVALLDTPAEESFDRLSRLAAQCTDAPIALVSLIDADRQFLKSCLGLPEPWASLRETPLSHSFCQYNRIAGEPLLIEDARTHPLFKDNLAIRDLNVIAYLGIPLVTSDGYVLGSFCVIDSKPRQWSAEELTVVRDLAAAVMTEVQLRAEISARRRAEDERDDLANLTARLRAESAAREQAEEQRRQLEAQVLQAQKLESLGLLAGGIAHDFNNLLTAMLGYATLAVEELTEDAAVLPLLRQVEQAATQATELVRQLLVYSGRARFTFQPCNLSPLVAQMSRLLETVVSKKAVLQLELAPDLPLVHGDHSQLRQVVMNLITNASDVLGDQPGTIILRTGSRYADPEFLQSPYVPGDLPAGIYVYLEVTDTGTGMTPAVLSRLFDPFFTTKARGHGLGLTTTLGVIRGHHGTIKVVSVPERGSTFQVFIPRYEEAAPEQSAVPNPAIQRGSGTILLVDDEPTVRSYVRTVLERAGLAVLEAIDGRDGVELFAQHREQIRVVLLDLTMPRLNGLEALAEMRLLQPDVRVILMSGYGTEEVTTRFADQNLAGFVHKPFTRGDLLPLIRRVLEE